MKKKTPPPTLSNRLRTTLLNRRLLVPVLIIILMLQSTAIIVLWAHATLISASLFNGSFWPPFGPDEPMNTVIGAPFKQQVQASSQAQYVSFLASPNDTRIFAPEARISLPLSMQNRRLVYNVYYSDDSTDPSKAIVAINTTSNLAAISRMQSLRQVGCGSKLAMITFNVQPDSMPYDVDLAATVPLADGRTMYIYKLTNQVCNPLDHPEANDEVVEVLKQAQSY